MKIYNIHTAKKRQSKLETSKGESLTVPHQADKLRDILISFANGNELPAIQRPTYHDHQNDFNIDQTLSGNFDLADASMLQAEINKNKARKEALEKAYAERVEKDKKAAEEAKKAAEAAEKEKQNNEGD